MIWDYGVEEEDNMLICIFDLSQGRRLGGFMCRTVIRHAFWHHTQRTLNEDWDQVTFGGYWS